MRFGVALLAWVVLVGCGGDSAELESAHPLMHLVSTPDAGQAAAIETEQPYDPEPADETTADAGTPSAERGADAAMAEPSPVAQDAGQVATHADAQVAPPVSQSQPDAATSEPVGGSLGPLPAQPGVPDAGSAPTDLWYQNKPWYIEAVDLNNRDYYTLRKELVITITGASFFAQRDSDHKDGPSEPVSVYDARRNVSIAGCTGAWSIVSGVYVVELGGSTLASLSFDMNAQKLVSGFVAGAIEDKGPWSQLVISGPTAWK